jgi:acetylornithine aminotransferase
MIDSIVPLYKATDRIIIKSKDCYLYDTDGKQYIDFESGVWCANLGHGDKMINKVIESQIKNAIHHGYHFRNLLAESLSVKLQDKMGIVDGQSVFLSSGSEAVNLAITLARHVTGRKKVLKMKSSYLSAYGYGKDSPENTFLMTINLDDLQSISQIDFKEVSCFVMETGGASFGVVRFPSKNFIRNIVQKAKSTGCMIVADEVTTGMGRTGRWFGFQHYDFVPDIVVTGKGLGNGYPISGVTISSTVADKFKENHFRYVQSHQNDPLGCAIGLEVIKQIEERNLIQKSVETGSYFQDELLSLKKKYPDKISEIRAKGLMLAVEFYRSFNGNFISDQLLVNGCIVGCKNSTLRFLPPLTITCSDIDRLIETIDGVLQGK